MGNFLGDDRKARGDFPTFQKEFLRLHARQEVGAILATILEIVLIASFTLLLVPIVIAIKDYAQELCDPNDPWSWQISCWAYAIASVAIYAFILVPVYFVRAELGLDVASEYEKTFLFIVTLWLVTDFGVLLMLNQL